MLPSFGLVFCGLEISESEVGTFHPPQPCQTRIQCFALIQLPYQMTGTFQGRGHKVSDSFHIVNIPLMVLHTV